MEGATEYDGKLITSGEDLDQTVLDPLEFVAVTEAKR